ncbi:hypothetical protein BCR36DRAFT_128317 [Piromyces finnis]|uniref:Uncharacterized protein n=1 Tax=Piromyces finnis TaxID=1754191 RepID=A0A1Y1V268_9FUNG|nr:hypothetical protein BCR36DRAFT_128317 [Piromyces finnis]|eukprot:ORX44339.1 hypothetical protein BCR36DRAFT_128317 [Piromyces finnis]
MKFILLLKPIEQLNIASDISSFSKADKHINNIIKDQQLEKISFINKEKTNCTANFQNIDSSTIKTYEIRNQKFIDNDISNFLLMQNNTSVLEKDTVERKQSIKRRKLNLSTIDYTTEKFVDIKSCKNNYHKVRLNKNKIYSKNIRIIGFLSSNTGKEQNIEYNENNDKYDQFWVIKDDKQLIVGSWKSSKISKENLKEILQYIFSDINKNLNPSLKYEGLISPKSKKYVAKSIFKI